MLCRPINCGISALITIMLRNVHDIVPNATGLAGDSPLENAELFSLVECVEDLWLKISAFFWEKEETRKVLII